MIGGVIFFPAAFIAFVVAAWPSARACHSLIFDERLGETILYGGASECGTAVVPDSSVWGWNGSRWQVVSTRAPGLREDALLAFDARRKVLVLYGGRNAGIVHEDTWEWDGAAWARKAESGGPGPLEHAAMAYDPAAGRTVLLGGAQRGGIMSGTTWLWDGTRWSRAAGSGPAARVGHSMAGAAAGVYAYGGFNQDAQLRDLWHWGGEAWTLLSRVGPTFTEGPALVTGNDDALMVVGPGTAASTDSLRVWRWSANAWSPVAQNRAPPNRVGQAVAYDRLRKSMVLFGGAGGGDVWEFDGRAWRRFQRTP